MNKLPVLVGLVSASAFAGPPAPTIVHTDDMDWGEGSNSGVTLKQIPGALGRMNLVRYAAGTLFPSHRHVNEQILMVQSGRYRITVEGEDHFLDPGDVIIIPSYATHEVEALNNSSHIEFFSPADLKPLAPE